MKLGKQQKGGLTMEDRRTCRIQVEDHSRGKVQCGCVSENIRRADQLRQWQKGSTRKEMADINDAQSTTEGAKEWRICKIHMGDRSKGKIQCGICISHRTSDEFLIWSTGKF